jgi:lipid A 3-O-deacylase
MARLSLMARRLAVGFALLAASAVAPPIAAAEDDPTLFTVQGGVYNVFKEDDVAGAFAFEVRGGERFLIFKPFGGMMGTSDGAFHGYGGILTDIYFGRRIVLTFGFAPGVYADGNGKELGYWLEFRSSGELAYRFDDRSRIGVMINHISNAGLGDRNPGTEVMMLSYSTPLSKIFGD